MLKVLAVIINIGLLWKQQWPWMDVCVEVSMCPCVEVRLLEEDPAFDAGVGSVLTRDGEVPPPARRPGGDGRHGDGGVGPGGGGGGVAGGPLLQTPGHSWSRGKY